MNVKHVHIKNYVNPVTGTQLHYFIFPAFASVPCPFFCSCFCRMMSASLCFLCSKDSPTLASDGGGLFLPNSFCLFRFFSLATSRWLPLVILCLPWSTVDRRHWKIASDSQKSNATSYS